MNQTFGPDQTDPSNAIFMPRRAGRAAVPGPRPAFVLARVFGAALSWRLLSDTGSESAGDDAAAQLLTGFGRLASTRRSSSGVKRVRAPCALSARSGCAARGGLMPAPTRRRVCGLWRHDRHVSVRSLLLRRVAEARPRTALCRPTGPRDQRPCLLMLGQGREGSASPLQAHRIDVASPWRGGRRRKQRRELVVLCYSSDGSWRGSSARSIGCRQVWQ